MTFDISLDTLTVPEKIQLLKKVWNDLCRNAGSIESPPWHQEVLLERRRRLEDGRATLSTWEDAKTRLMSLGK
jgi:putative addiction module component (TIGR02574 family)